MNKKENISNDISVKKIIEIYDMFCSNIYYCDDDWMIDYDSEVCRDLPCSLSD